MIVETFKERGHRIFLRLISPNKAEECGIAERLCLPEDREQIIADLGNNIGMSMAICKELGISLDNIIAIVKDNLERR